MLFSLMITYNVLILLISDAYCIC